jgi:ABC-type glycerol-3-phosphate transport system substrate-binding protein
LVILHFKTKQAMKSMKKMLLSLLACALMFSVSAQTQATTVKTSKGSTQPPGQSSTDKKQVLTKVGEIHKFTVNVSPGQQKNFELTNEGTAFWVKKDGSEKTAMKHIAAWEQKNNKKLTPVEIKEVKETAVNSTGQTKYPVLVYKDQTCKQFAWKYDLIKDQIEPLTL